MSARHETQITPEVLEILHGIDCDGRAARITQKLDRAVYTRVAKVLEIMGGRWDRKAGATLFDGSARDAIDDAITTGSVVDLQKVFQFYETPAEVAAQLVEMAGLPPGSSILEPSAGSGRIVDAALAAGHRVSACEIQDRFHGALVAKGCTMVGRDFLNITMPPDDGGMEFDGVIANPPFTRCQDVGHVSKMFTHVKDGGVVVAVMSPAWLFRGTLMHVEFRRFVAEYGGTWTELPPSTFASSGTHVQTGILRLVAPIGDRL